MDRKTLDRLEFDKIRQRLVACCACSLGKGHAERLRPAGDRVRVAARLEETTAARELLAGDGDAPFGGISDIGQLAQRSRAGSCLGPDELLTVAAALRGAGRLRKALLGQLEDGNVLFPLAARTHDLEPLWKAIEKTVNEDGHVVDSASDELRSLRHRARSLEGQVQERINSYLSNPKTQRALQDRLITIRRDRPCIPVRAEFKRAVPGVVHDVSASGATLFVEPQPVVELGDELHRTRAAEREEVARILRELTARVGERYPEIEETLRAVGILDFIFGRAKLSLQMDAMEPELPEEQHLVLIKARHPLIPADEVVPISLWLGEDFDTLLVTGPNTGGKTVALKTAGLLSLMAQSGLHVPVDRGSKVPVFRDVFADIGDEQSIEQSLSTFSSHMSNIRRIVQQARRDCLVLLDEIGVGTDPEEGAALAIAVMRHLGERGALVIATTHYNSLKTFALKEPRVENASVEFDPDTLTPTFRLRIGMPGNSNALAIARRIGLPKAITRAARDLVPKERLMVEEAILEMERARRAMEDEKRELARARRKAEEQASRHESEAERIERERRKAIDEGWQEAREIVAAARETSRSILSDLRKQGREGKATQQAQDELRALAEQLEASPPHEEPTAPPPPLPDLRRGDAVRLVSLGHRGVVLDGPDEHGRVQVSVGAVRMEVDGTDLEPLGEVSEARVRDSIGLIRIEKALSVPRELSLRGMTVEEALAELDKFLDDASLAELETVTIVHGKGTGVLREAVQSYLRATPLARSFRFADPQEGGIGVTVVDMA